jgi:hexosaminidase
VVWAGFIDVDTAYNWDPGAQLPGVDEKSILGVEAPLWTETITSINDVEYMTFPRLSCRCRTGLVPQIHPRLVIVLSAPRRPSPVLD